MKDSFKAYIVKTQGLSLGGKIVYLGGMDPIAQAQDDLRREQLLNAFRKFAPLAAIALVVLILGVAGREAWEAYAHHDAKKNTAVLMQAADSGDSIPALLAAAAKDEGARAAIARLVAFQRMSLEEQKTGGLDVLDALRKDKKSPQAWRDFAALTLVRARIAFGAGEPEADELLTILEPAVKNAQSPWHVPSRMESALILGEMKADAKAAGALLQGLNPADQVAGLGEKLAILKAHYNVADVAQ